MKRDALERLMIDRALGELSGDVADLLDAFVDGAPATRDGMNEFRETVRLAAQVVTTHGDESRSLPPLSHRRLAADVARRRWLGRIRPMAAAAVIGLAFFLGMRVGSSESPQFAPPNVMAADISSRAGARDIWRATPERIQSRSPASDVRAVHWTSPLVWPVRESESAL